MAFLAEIIPAYQVEQGAVEPMEVDQEPAIRLVENTTEFQARSAIRQHMDRKADELDAEGLVHEAQTMRMAKELLGQLDCFAVKIAGRYYRVRYVR